MLQQWLLREPSLCFGLPVYLVAAIVLPLHLGWTGASLSFLAVYLVIAAGLFSLADAVLHRSLYPRLAALVTQAVMSLLALAVPAALAFAVGSVVGPVEEAFDEEACAAQGAGEADTAAAEADDTFDVTPDCTGPGQPA
jgi:hypothetical protein